MAPQTEVRPVTYGEARTEGQKLYDAAVMERVKKGMALLEREYGPDWVDHIDLSELRLWSGGSCVLGQLYGSWDDQIDEFWPDDAYRESAEHGFSIGHEISGVRRQEAWNTLQTAWEEALTPVVTRRENDEHDG